MFGWVEFPTYRTVNRAAGTSSKLATFESSEKLDAVGWERFSKPFKFRSVGTVALKILRFSSVSDKDAIERFQREAETVATLHHTNIVPIFFVGSEKSVNYYAMQFIDGRDLAQLIRADKESPISPEQVVALGLQAAEALAHAQIVAAWFIAT